ncbi:MAG: protein-L-isoaspartate(D-aspartate) O-methyltransferase [Alteromonadaceae bacterium]|jgi:protein-L-isoaspartate(D-aspartate) O-methyltransferase
MRSSYARAGEQLAQRLIQDGIKDQQVLKAVSAVPRHLFVEPVLAHKAYENTALPIGQGQTISQPYIVARMTELLLQYGATDKVLEIGTGSGYQTAVIAQLADQVYSVERIKSLQFQAKRRLQNMDLYNVSMKHGDGWKGWQTKAPFDGIIVTAAPESVPIELLSQLKEGGILIVPVGVENQVLSVIQRHGEAFITSDICAVRFVPLVPGDLA